MYRVMIVDDEMALRNLLKETVNWEKLGLVVVGEAASGIEAINTIDEIKPDILFVDVKMPFMNGIEFSEIVKKQYPEIAIVILTAFDEFDYARSCIGIGVVDYLLKPVSVSEVETACKKAMEQLKTRTPDKKEGLVIIKNEMYEVTKYIEKNYKNPELNLSFIADVFSFNASYLSRRYKECTGQNILEEILKCRMEHAMDCLKKRKLMYITATEVGIPDPNYFGKCFKKYTGKSYTEMLSEYEKECV